MASAAEQLAANVNFGAFAKADELKRRIWFTIAALIVYRFGTYIPVPGVNAEVFKSFTQDNGKGIIGMFNMFAGGALGRAAIFALNVMPYISASIIIQLMSAISPNLVQLKKEGEQGRKKINQYTRYLTILLAIVQGYGLAVGLESYNNNGQLAVADPGWFFRLTAVTTFVGGTVFLMWLGEQITARGVGNGISLIIFVGIIAELPGAISGVLELSRQNVIGTATVLFIFLVAIGIIFFIVFMERAQRRLLVKYPKRQIGNKISQDETSHLPLKLNTAGVIPPIFAFAILSLPALMSGFAVNSASSSTSIDWVSESSTISSLFSDILVLFGQGKPLYIICFILLIIFSAFFYTAHVFNPKDTADNLKKQGGFIPGIRPGERTAEYIDKVLTRVTAIGAIYLAFVCVLPEILRAELDLNVPFGGTSLLIMVSVTMDTVAQIHSHLLAHQYEGLIKKAKLRGARGK